MKILRKLALFATLAAALAVGQAGSAAALTPQQELVDKSRITFEKLITNYEFGELPGYLKRAKAVMIFPEIFKAGFVIGGEGGNGVLMVRDANQGWSQPAFYTLAAGSLGLQIGGQMSETVFTIMSDKALQAVLNDQMKFGGDMSIAAGPIGKGLGANTTTNLEADVYTFAKTSGLFGGVSFNGAGILRKDDWNGAYYGPGTLPQWIVIDRKVSNPNAQGLVNALAPY
ncbi:lipid-binding SYLF domain-containing protein [Dongia mobilis]|uniref:Lipid-binding SYLF domain-containing protein n=1 Tax=Dongia mobilis TaxID=578943 RepID=A0A4R6WKL3_9PROT|nr:lipid-binding SYLF domain-containing protein [Dongia mobilis]TDQ78771.1 lipid-binding SYLF domain-containing protein [Dongia mobilis]